MQEKLLYLQVKSELKAAKSGNTGKIRAKSGEKRQKTVSSNRFQKWLKKSKKERTWRERRELRREQNPFSHLLFRHSQNTIGENFYTFLLLLTKKRKEV